MAIASNTASIATGRAYFFIFIHRAGAAPAIHRKTEPRNSPFADKSFRIQMAPSSWSLSVTFWKTAATYSVFYMANQNCRSDCFHLLKNGSKLIMAIPSSAHPSLHPYKWIIVPDKTKFNVFFKDGRRNSQYRHHSCCVEWVHVGKNSAAGGRTMKDNQKEVN